MDSVTAAAVIAGGVSVTVAFLTIVGGALNIWLKGKSDAKVSMRGFVSEENEMFFNAMRESVAEVKEENRSLREELEQLREEIKQTTQQWRAKMAAVGRVLFRVDQHLEHPPSLDVRDLAILRDENVLPYRWDGALTNSPTTPEE